MAGKYINLSIQTGMMCTKTHDGANTPWHRLLCRSNKANIPGNATVLPVESHYGHVHIGSIHFTNQVIQLYKFLLFHLAA
ncbi:hypothetical protein ACM6L3_16835 [Paenibacillus larvae]